MLPQYYESQDKATYMCDRNSILLTVALVSSLRDTVRYQNGVGDKMSFTHHWVWVFLFGLVYCFITGWQLTLVMLAMVPVAVAVSGVVNQVSNHSFIL